MATNMDLYINNSITEQPIGTSGVDWILVNPNADYFIFSAGGAGVADGEDIPTETELNRAATQLDSINDVVVAKYFLADISADLLKEIKNAGNQNKRYAWGCDFDGATASEPQLEAWDNTDMDSFVDPAIGSGSANASWYKGISTTTSSPGVDWTGTPIAGSGISNIILLNDGNGALTGAADLYFNFKVVIPGGYLNPALHVPIFAITYTTN